MMGRDTDGLTDAFERQVFDDTPDFLDALANGRRRLRAEKALGSYLNTEKEAQTALIDLLADLMHWAVARKDTAFAGALETAEMHFLEETSDG